MIAAVEQRFSDDIAVQAAAQFGLEADSLQALDAFESHVFTGLRAAQPVILKITHSLRRTPQQLEAEARFVEHLANCGCRVARQLRSVSGNLVETFRDQADGFFYAVLSERAMGHRVAAADWDASLFQNWGQAMAQMHEAVQGKAVSAFAPGRMTWYEEPQLQVDGFLPADDPVRHWVNGTIAELRAIQWPETVCGLVHADFHAGNFLIDEGELTVFDFDDCGNHPFVNDIAIAIYYALYYPPKDIVIEAGLVSLFIRSFLMGYARVRRLPAGLETVPIWMHLRHALLYCVLRETHWQAGLAVGDEAVTTKAARYCAEVVSGLPWVDVVKAAVQHVHEAE